MQSSVYIAGMRKIAEDRAETPTPSLLSALPGMGAVAGAAIGAGRPHLILPSSIRSFAAHHRALATAMGAATGAGIAWVPSTLLDTKRYLARPRKEKRAGLTNFDMNQSTVADDDDLGRMPGNLPGNYPGGRLPGYSAGGPVRKDGYLVDARGRPYARVHAGERVVPKEKTAGPLLALFLRKLRIQTVGDDDGTVRTRKQQLY